MTTPVVAGLDWARVEPAEPRVAFGTDAGIVLLLDGATGRLLVGLDGTTSAVRTLRFSAGGETLVSTSAEGCLIFWGTR